MEIKETILKTATNEEKNAFTENANRNNYIVKVTETEYEAWGYTDEELLASAKQNKYDEANNGAKTFLESGNALFEFEDNFDLTLTKIDGQYFMRFPLGIISQRIFHNWLSECTLHFTKKKRKKIWRFKKNHYLCSVLFD